MEQLMSLATDIKDKVDALNVKLDAHIATDTAKDAQIADLQAQLAAALANAMTPADSDALQAAAAGLDVALGKV